MNEVSMTLDELLEQAKAITNNNNGNKIVNKNCSNASDNSDDRVLERDYPRYIDDGDER